MLRRVLRLLRRERQLLFHTPQMASGRVDNDLYWDDRKRSTNTRRPNTFQRARADWILERIEPTASVLDVGAGDGSMLEYMAARKVFRGVGADVSERSRAELQGKGFEAIAIDAAIGGSAWIPEVDHVMACEVLEHVPNPEVLLQAMVSKARKSVFFSVPNTGYYAYRTRLLLGRFPMQWRTHPGEHVRFWTLADMRWWLQQLGYAKRAELHTYEGIPVLASKLPAWFAMGILVQIRTD